MPAVQDDSNRNRRTAKRVLAIGLPLVVIAGTGIGYAYWTAGGTGTGSATADSATTPVDLLANVTGLAPGAPDVTADVMATNNNSGPVRITGLVVPTTLPTPTSPTNACQTVTGGHGVTVTNITALTGPFDLAKGAPATKIGTVTFHMANLTTSQDPCKGASFNVTLTTN